MTKESVTHQFRYSSHHARFESLTRDYDQRYRAALPRLALTRGVKIATNEARVDRVAHRGGLV